jgi:hypothetical protein
MLSGVIASPSNAAAVRSGFAVNSLAANDDGSTGLLNIGFSSNFFGNTYTQLYLNNNGNLTFNGPLSGYTPFALTTNTSTPIIAPFFADVDTRNASSGLARWGTGLVAGRNAFGATWVDVGYYNTRANKLNSFQALLIDRSDTGVGNFDIEFNYDRIQWETGDANGGTNGLGGTSARAGFSNGSGLAGTFAELTGSGVNGALLDGGGNSLVAGSNVDLPGRYLFQARNGSVDPPVSTVPEPASVIVFAGLLAASAGMARRHHKR